MIAMNFGHGMMFGPESCYFTERSGPRVRYSGASFGFQRQSAAASPRSSKPRWSVISAALVSVMMIALALITLAAALAAPETKGGSLID
jgi:MHS family shikimate/dehydroshikimate transporter-like MFS transporter